MPLTRPIHPGKVDWTGENPGILLKQTEDGAWSALALFFRILYSPAGRGTALLLFEKPDEEASLPEAANVLLSDNREMAEYLKTSFIAKLGAFGGAPAFKAMQHVDIEESYATGDPRSRYTEVIKARGLDIELIWEQLGTPTALELPKELTGPKEKEMYTLLVESRDARIMLNGRRLPGQPMAREQAGIKTTTAFLYFSETWIWPAE